MISVIIPCYNEEAVLPQVFERVSAAAQDWGEDYEILLVDDGSRDGTWAAIERCHRRDPHWKGIGLARNFGHQAAIGAGLEHADGDCVACLDADLQDPPELVADMLQKWRDGFDVIYGVRTRRPEGWLKRVCYSTFYHLLARASEVTVPRDAGDFGLMDRRVVEALRGFKEQHPFWRGLRCWSGFRHCGLTYVRQERQAGQPQYTLAKLVKLATDGLLCLSQTPLRAVGWVGTAVTALAAMLGGWLGTQGASPTTALALIWGTLFLGGVQLLCLGVLGQYLGRIYDEVRQRPRWVIARTVGLGAAAASPVYRSMARAG